MPELDSGAEDCTTRIALSTVETLVGSSYLFISDLSQANSFLNTWTAPEQFVSFPEFNVFQYGTNALVVAPGSQLAIVTSELSDPHLAVVRLPSSAGAGSGTPMFQDYAFATMPDITTIPPFGPFNVGADPHVVTAYVSPNDGRAYAVVTNWKGDLSASTHVAVIDLQKVLDAPRFCMNGVCSHFVDPSYDMTQAVRYLKD